MNNDFMIAECGIRQLHARAIDTVWRKDAAAFAACFAEKGEWKIAGVHMRGRAEIAKMWRHWAMQYLGARCPP